MGEILVNNGDSGGPISIVTIDDGFVVAWTESGIITCARFSASGVRVGVNFTVNTPETPATWPVMALIQTGFVVAWNSRGNLLLQALTVDGVKNGAPLPVNPGSTRVSEDHPPAITRILDAGLVLSWGEAGQQVIRAQIFNSDLTKRGEAFTVKEPKDVNSQVNIQPIITYLDGFEIMKDGQPTGEIERGGFVIAWSSGRSFGQTFSQFQFYDANGSRLGQQSMAKFDLFLRPGSLAPLPFPPGGFCGIQDNQSVLNVDAYDARGNFQFSSNVTHFEDHTVSTLPVIRTTPNNGVVITWVERSSQSGGQGTNIMAALVTGDSQVLGPVKLNTEPARGQTTPCVTPVITDFGDIIAFAWVDRSLSTPPPLPSIKGRILAGDNLFRDMAAV